MFLNVGLFCFKFGAPTLKKKKKKNFPRQPLSYTDANVQC